MDRATSASRQKGETIVFSSLVEEAIELAAEWHDQTYRKSRWRDIPFDPPPDAAIGIPVMAHVTAVGMLLQRAGWDDEVVAAGFLHDIIEDTNRFGQTFQYEMLRQKLGEAVADLVLEVSEQKYDEHGNWRPWRVRKETYIESLRNGTPGGVAISLADKLHNLWTMNQAIDKGIDIFESTESRKALSAGPEQQRWFFESVLEASALFDDSRLDPLRDELRDELERFCALWLEK